MVSILLLVPGFLLTVRSAGFSRHFGFLFSKNDVMFEENDVTTKNGFVFNVQ